VAITIKLSCSFCGKEREIGLATDSGRLTPATPVGIIVECAKWIAQQNGVHLDIYCSKNCDQGITRI
jgi:hypothetical protein